MQSGGPTPITAIRVRAQSASRTGAMFWHMGAGRAVDAFHNRTWHRMVTFPVSCLLTAGVSFQDEWDWEIVRADSIAEALKRIEHEVATVREDSEPWRRVALH